MNIGAQYYRPPFPVGKHWDDDLCRMRDTGLDTVQFWVLWGWVESKPGVFDYDDYDRLMELAGKHGLKVVLSTIAEIQPLWIHREVPGSEMITNMGWKVVSSGRGECSFGLTPGGCTDHPEVWERMASFLSATVTRYRSVPHLAGWDAWNELRWRELADGLVCYCPHTLKAFRAWLDETYGGLDGLNRAWLRRYGCWDEVMPGKTSGRLYTEMMAFQHFLTVRANRHAAARYRVMKALDPAHPITVHAGEPSVTMCGGKEVTPCDRGNDWAFADAMDGVGCSSFPKWVGIDDADFGMRVEIVKSAAQGKLVWLSEIQGGRSSSGFLLFPAVDAASQQRWIWNGLACGADTLLFWCWRDEVFGSESAGFGIVGRDGLAGERVAALRATGGVLREHRRLFDGYRPARSDVGILYSPRSYYLYWAQEGTAQRGVGALKAYARGLVRRSIPYVFVEEDHLDPLKDLKILVLPRTIVTTPRLEARLETFVREGGTLVCESECGAFGQEGFYREPDERWLARFTGVEEVGRRAPSGPFEADYGDRTFKLDGAVWCTPMTGAGAAIARHADGDLVMEVAVGRGRVVLIGTYLGGAPANPDTDFESFLEFVVRRAGWTPEIEVLDPLPTKDNFLYVKSGASGGRRLVFVFFPAACRSARLRFAPGFFREARVCDILSGRDLDVSGGEVTVSHGGSGIAVLVEGQANPAE